MTSIWVLMVRRSDGRVYPDMHKVPDAEFYLSKDEADEHWAAQGDMRKHYHVVELIVDVAPEE